MLQVLKKVVFWTYPRGSWQYDILCLLILCFIFLTPRAVFDGTAFLDEQIPAVPQEEEPVQALVDLPEPSVTDQDAGGASEEGAPDEPSDLARLP